MDICFVSSLEHLASSKVITSLLNNQDFRLQGEFVEEQYDRLTLKVKELLSQLLPCSPLKAKSENFITPILCSAINWIEYYEDNFFRPSKLHLPLNDIVRRCWLSDGSIDREKWAKICLKNSDESPLNQFVFACLYCVPEDILNQWEMLSNIEKIFYRRSQHLHSIARRWIEWLDSSANKDWESCVAWILETPLWTSNLSILKRVLQTLSPAEKREYLLRALQEDTVDIDVMKFGLQIISSEERLMVFKKSPVQVVKCILSWPLRRGFVDLVKNLWPSITADNFRDILVTILNMILDEQRDYIDLLEILKSFWDQSPSDYKETAQNDRAIFPPLNYALEYNFSKQFNRRVFYDLCIHLKGVYPHVYFVL